mgnify:CR=1 FL=1
MDPLQPRTPGQSDQGKIVSAADAVALIRDGDTIATSGFVGIGFAEAIAIALAERVTVDGATRQLTHVSAAGQGGGQGEGLNHLEHARRRRGVSGGHTGRRNRRAQPGVRWRSARTLGARGAAHPGARPRPGGSAGGAWGGRTSRWRPTGRVGQRLRNHLPGRQRLRRDRRVAWTSSTPDVVSMAVRVR